jgi:cytochrome c biogenesis protein CcdA
MLLFLVTVLFARSSFTLRQPQRIRNMILLFGSTYIIAVYLTYVIIGLSLRQVMAITPFQNTISKIGASILILAGITKLKDVFWPGLGIGLKLSPSGCDRTRRLMAKVSLPVAFIVGVLVALFEFPCTGGMYIGKPEQLGDYNYFSSGICLSSDL